MSTKLRSAERSPVSPGPGEPLRSWLGWTPLLRTPSSGVWLFREAVRGEQLLAALVSTVDWVFRGFLPHCMGGSAALSLLICVWAKGSCWATNWGTLLGAPPGFVEGHRTSDGTLVCRWGYADVCEP